MNTIIPQNKPYYVYTLAYPESMSGNIFYVGKGQTYANGLDRIDDHEREAKRKRNIFNKMKVAVIKEIWASNERVVKEKIAFFEEEKDAYIYEWGLINMTVYAKNLTNIDHGIHQHRKLNLDQDNLQKYTPFCIQRHQGGSNNAHLIIHHKVSDIQAFCEYKHISINILAKVLEDHPRNFTGYSLIQDCNCEYTSMTSERKILTNYQEEIRCAYCHEVIPYHKVNIKCKRQFCNKSHYNAYLDKCKKDPKFGRAELRKKRRLRKKEADLRDKKKGHF